MHQPIEPSFESDCRRKFSIYCGLYAAASYHSEKRHYAEKAYEVIEAWLDYQDVQAL